MKAFPEENTVVVYAINHLPTCRYMIEVSIDSIRRCSKIPIVVFSPRELNLAQQWSDVSVVETRIEPLSEIYFSRWRRFVRLPFERLIVADADTYFYQPPEILLERYRECDLYAREDLGAQRSRDNTFVGRVVFAPQVDWHMVDEQRRTYRARNIPIYNSGLMIFNNHFAARLRPAIQLVQTLRHAWTAGDLPYPCTNPHIMEEVAASYAMGLVERFLFGVLDKADAPFFVEIAQEGAISPFAVHVWRANYKQFLLHQFGRSMLRRFEETYREDLLLRAQLAGARRTHARKS